MLWSSMWTRSPRFRPSIAPSRCCRSAQGRSSGAPMITSGTAHPAVRHPRCRHRQVIGKCFRRHRSREFRKFLDHVDANVPEGLDIHIVMDNCSTHKTKEIRDWFARQRRWHVHFTPTPASWLNQVERFFADLTDKQIGRRVHRSTVELKQADHRVHRAGQQGPQAVPVARVGRRDPHLHQALPPENPRTRAGSIITLPTLTSGHYR